MKNMTNKVIELKNIYTGEIVCATTNTEKRVDGNMTFIQVFKKEEPNRKYFVNEAAFQKLHK